MSNLECKEMSEFCRVSEAKVSRRDIEEAFAQFSDQTEKLTLAYQDLEDQIKELNRKLKVADKQRLKEVASKQRLANHLQRLLDFLPAGVITLDAQGKIVDANPAAIDLLGEPLYQYSWVEIIQRAFSPKEDDGHEVSLKDGRRVKCSTCSLGDEPGQIILLTDLSQTRDLQERLSHHKRLTAMGKMAATLAHQIRTPLSAALLYASHLNDPNLDDDNHIRFSAKLLMRLKQLENQVKDMLMYARGENSVTEIINIDDVVVGLVQTVDDILERENAHLLVNNKAKGALLRANKASLISSLQNLINNSIESTGKGACLTLNITRNDNNYIEILMSDDGPGIDDGIKEKITEPFFTTRSEGTGLGLAVVKAVIEAHHGIFSIESTGKCGAHIKIQLPISMEADKNMLASRSKIVIKRGSNES